MPSRVPEGERLSPLRVSRLEKDGYVCFVGHYHDGSQTIACAKEGYDEWTLWYIELVLLLVGGVLTALAEREDCRRQQDHQLHRDEDHA